MNGLQWSLRFITFAMVWVSLSATVTGQPPARKHSRARTPGVNIILDPFLPRGTLPAEDGLIGPYPSVIQSRGSHRVLINRVPQPLAQDAISVELFIRHAEVAFHARQYDRSFRMLRHGLIEAPADGKLHLLLSHLQLATGDYPGAARSLLQAVAILNQRDWGQVLRQTATYYAPGEHARVLAGLHRSIEQDPNVAAAYLVRGYHLLFTGQKGRARQDFLTATRLDTELKIPGELLQMTEAATVPESISPPVPVLE